MKAKALFEYINIKASCTCENDSIVEVDCCDYDDYRLLPAAIEVEGKILGKTGWNSDRQYACFKSNVILGKRVDVYG